MREDAWLFLGLCIDPEQEEASNDEQDLVEEFDAIKRVVKEKLSVSKSRLQVTWEALVQVLGESTPYEAIVIAGHGTTQGLEFGKKAQPEIRRLAKLLAQIKGLFLLILNCCDSETLASQVLKERRRHQQENSLVIYCWKGKVHFEGARYMNLFFCEEIMALLSTSKSGSGAQGVAGGGLKDLLDKERETVFRDAFKKAIMKSAEKGFTVRKHQPFMEGDETLGEPMLLPFFSSNASYEFGMLVKYKVAETGVELIKRLKTVVRNGYLLQEGSEITTLYHFGEFIAWFNLLGEEDPDFYSNSQYVAVLLAFSEQGVRLDSHGVVSSTTDDDSKQSKQGCGRDFATTVVDHGCLFLYRMDLRYIAEVMRKDPNDPYSVRQFNDFCDMFCEQEKADHAAASLRDAFAKLESDIGIIGARSFPTLPLSQPKRRWATRASDLLGVLFTWLFGWLIFLLAWPDLHLYRLPFIRVPLPASSKQGANPLYICMSDGKWVVRSDSNVYRRIAWIHDAVLALVLQLDPSLEDDMRHEPGNFFSSFSAFDHATYPAYWRWGRAALHLKKRFYF